jgi:hypothetical protein
MHNLMSYHLNKHVLVSIPEVLGDREPHRCRLAGVEPFGLWLESDDLSRIAFSNKERPLAKVFVPFTRIVYLIEAPGVSPAVPIADPAAKLPPRPRRKSSALPKIKGP